MTPSKAEPAPGSSGPKLAIKGFSLSAKSSAKPKPPPSSSLGKRPRSTFQDHYNDDSGSDLEGDSGRGRHEVVTGFAEGGAISRRDEQRKEPVDLVIPKIANRDWRGEIKAKKGKKNLLPPEVQRQMEDDARRRNGGEGVKTEGVDVVNSKDGEIKWGLTVRKREVKVEANEEVPRSAEEAAERPGEVAKTDQAAEATEEKPKTADEEALAALLGNRDEKKGPDLVIPVATSTVEEPLSEADAYRRAIAAAPDASTLEDYERVPVEEFGAALLRGMGWKGEKKGQVRDVKRRQNLLGLGAKELKDAEELGAWVQKSDTKRLKERRGGGAERERRPKVSEYKSEKERRDERREERGGGGYRGERERERERDYRERDRRR
ncbi:Uncharacterized protein BP5553_01357 [Venustampulla echinocandica]|uniref:Pre-mRNA-splicing factor n=1 Tax=Venustampulla echinocandica TaxID=2656787 RepID=A0A370U0T5_9HELO|nr:Uncharacterized protein BP5553_01357 [Venustampulla echinocandica]RDL41378.1 Uncharacterized protein BP5553_01357 [Venustampulla echinocandica]